MTEPNHPAADSSRALSGPHPGASAALARRIAPGRVHGGAERPVTVDQTNRSVVVDESVIVKWFRPPVPMPHRGSAALSHLRDVGFDAMPEFLGVELERNCVVASVTEFVAGARDGWEWYVDELERWIAGDHPSAALKRRAEAIGALAGRLHVALATASDQCPEPVGVTTIRTLHQRATALWERVRDNAAGTTAERLAGRWTRIRAALDALDVDRATPVIRIHGDLHVGNVLACGERLLVVDFDGNPIAADGVPELQPPALDVASLLQSIDHVGRIVDHRTAGAHANRIAAWIDDSAARALGRYRAELARASRRELLDDTLLTPLKAMQELYELAYAASHLPHWVYVPEAALAAMFPYRHETGDASEP